MNEIWISNTFSGKKEKLTPLTPGKIRMYVCGVTVYDQCHLGHARAYVVFDTIRKILEYFNYEVQYVQNFTDIDDKIIAKAEAEKKSFSEIADFYIKKYFEFSDGLGIARASSYPQATHYIPQIIRFIQSLIEKQKAYAAGGDVYFSIDQFKDYGKLSKRNLDSLLSGARVEINPFKKNPLDFVLWKKAKPGEPSWESPFGAGRPGWHIECSVMSEELGLPIDIHGGGRDLIFPHHENEIAQSESLHQKTFVNYWLHNGFVNIKKEKMSKSLGNMLWANDLIQKYSAQAIRLYLLSTHYTHPIDFDEAELEQHVQALKSLNKGLSSNSSQKLLEFDAWKQKIESSLADDFNTAKTIGYLFELSKELSRQSDPAQRKQFETWLKLLGVYKEVPAEKASPIPAEILELVEKRKIAKAQKDFSSADAIRKQIEAYGYEVRDTATGTSLERKN